MESKKRVDLKDTFKQLKDGRKKKRGLLLKEGNEEEKEGARFVTTPRAMQAMLAGSGSRIGRFKPRVHITLWS